MTATNGQISRREIFNIAMAIILYEKYYYFKQAFSVKKRNYDNFNDKSKNQKQKALQFFSKDKGLTLNKKNFQRQNGIKSTRQVRSKTRCVSFFEHSVFHLNLKVYIMLCNIDIATHIKHRNILKYFSTLKLIHC